MVQCIHCNNCVYAEAAPTNGAVGGNDSRDAGVGKGTQDIKN